jgi:hypothetical protein
MAARAGKGEGRKSPNSTSDDARSGNVQHTAANGGYRFFFRLLTGGLLVRIQPEEPIFSTIYRLTAPEHSKGKVAKSSTDLRIQDKH